MYGNEKLLGHYKQIIVLSRKHLFDKTIIEM